MCVRKRARGIDGKPSATRWCSGVRLEHLHPNSVCVSLFLCMCVCAQEKLSKHPSQFSLPVSADERADRFPGLVSPAVTCSRPLQR